MISRSKGRASGGLLLLLVVVSGCRERPSVLVEQQSQLERPSVLFVTFCTMRTDRIGAYGERITGEPTLTPNLDRLAAEGWLFRAHYTQATYSGGAFASMLTGRYPFHHGVYDHPRRLPDAETTLGEVFRGADYATGAFLTHRYLGAKWNYAQGFEVLNRFGEFSVLEKAATEESRRDPEARIEAALAWVESLGDQPWLLWYQTQLTHHFPEVDPERLPQALRDKLDELKAIPAGRLMFDVESLQLTDDDLESLIALHDAAVAETDALVGRLVDGLRELGRFDDTIVVVTADHGEALSEGGLYFNHDANLVEPTVRVPLIVRIPGRESGQIDAVTRNIDLLPTLGELAGLEAMEAVDGTSLLPLLEGQDMDLPAFAETRPLVENRRSLARYPLEIPGVEGKLRMIRRGEHKLVVRPRQESYGVDLFDLGADPGETTDLAPERPDSSRELATELERWFAGYEDADTAPLELEDEDVESLRALGYID